MKYHNKKSPGYRSLALLPSPPVLLHRLRRRNRHGLYVLYHLLTSQTSLVCRNAGGFGGEKWRLKGAASVGDTGEPCCSPKGHASSIACDLPKSRIDLLKPTI